MAEITNGCHGPTHLAVRIEVLSSGEDPGPIVRGGMFTFGSGQDMVWLRVTFYVAVMTLSCLPLAFLPERNGERSLGSPRSWLIIIYHRLGQLCVATTSQFWGFVTLMKWGEPWWHAFCQVRPRGDGEPPVLH